MSKVEIAGPRQKLDEVLDRVRSMGILQLDSSIEIIKTAELQNLQISHVDDEKTVFEKIYLDELRTELEELFSYLPTIPLRENYLEPAVILETISLTLKKHLSQCRTLFSELEALQLELSNLQDHLIFFNALVELLPDVQDAPHLDFIGLRLADDNAKKVLRSHLDCLTDGSCELVTIPLDDSSFAGLITIEKHRSEEVRKTLKDEDLPEYSLPDEMAGLSFVERARLLNKKTTRLNRKKQLIEEQLQTFVVRWGSIYQNVLAWVNDRYSLLQIEGKVFETEMCFFIYGWMPSANVAVLRDELQKTFNADIVVQELAIRQEDIDNIPVELQNPLYFKPFERFARLLPIPAYTSYDPTPFIGIFFPVFFGIIVGDAGYGILLLIISLLIIRSASTGSLLLDAGRILGACSFHTIVFGILYGEALGGLGHTLLGMEPILFHRRNNITAMLSFALGIGFIHIIFGLCLGVASDIKKKTGKEALAKFLNIIVICSLTVLVVTIFGSYSELVTKPIIIGLLILTPLILFTGGLLAPLELLKNVGHIISYARIMAIGLTSVLLAHVANRLSGLTGDIILGALVGGLLHLINIIIGVFSSSIHSIRLHYVEFFNKFMEPGGKKFTPLKKEN
jgi:V/A-type H+-transporting ATPase subunit I